jgi:hypothetical protein
MNFHSGQILELFWVQSENLNAEVCCFITGLFSKILLSFLLGKITDVQDA